MFQTLNLFKSINCPYYSSATNTLTCDRPHCQFKHPSIHSSNASMKNVAIEVTEQTTTLNDPNMLADNNLKQLPSMLENISNALQTVQQIISSSNIGDSLSKFNTNSSNQTASQISATLANLNNVLQSVSTKQDSQNLEKSQSSTNTPIKKSSSLQKNLKRQQSAPDYNPTPIVELKKRAEVDLSPTSLIDEEEGYKRRKYDNESPINETIKTDFKKLKVEEISTANSIQNKCDLVSFSKLSLSQQVLKRYEMLNKPAPSTAAIIEAKLKKHQVSSVAKSCTEPINHNVPHLIIDSNPNSANKIPLVIRQRYLKVIFENGKSSFATIQKACEKAAEQEKSIFDRAKNKTIYTNLAANLICSLRTQSQQNSSAPAAKPIMSLKNPQFKPKIVQPAPTATSSFSHETMLSGHKANKCSYSINRVKQLEFKDLSMSQLYKIFYSYVLTEKQLNDNSFPRWNDDKKLAFIPNLTKSNDKKTEIKPKVQINGEIINQICKRCNKTFNLRCKDLFYLTSNSECVFHWGKLRNVRVDKAIEHKYSCCSGGLDSDGCEVGKHVYDGDYNGNGNGSNLTGYFQVNNDYSDSKTLNIYALDCEMCYTTKGLELTRITIVDVNSKEVYESLVKPDTQILDYNTRWSGVTEQSLKNCNKKLKHVQADLAKFFSKDTILIGHSLDSDFKALKLIHTNVIDTSVVFPHKMGPPYKRALRNLMSEHLQKIIQEDTEGHDSKEDAASCVSLMIWKINEDLRTKKFNEILNESNLMKTNSISLNSPRSLTNSKIK